MQCIVTNLNNKKKKYSTHRQKKSCSEIENNLAENDEQFNQSG